MKREKIVLLSPHHDDIAFSIGGMISLDYIKNTDYAYYLVNIFNKTCYSLPTFQTNHISKQRNSEDDKFVKLFMLNKINLSLSDSSLIGHTAHSEAICVPSDTRRSHLTNKLDNIFKCIKPNRVFCPLGIGGHIDHKMVKEVCLEIFKNSYHKLFFYEDLPYAYGHNPNDMETTIKKLTNLELHAHDINITSVWHMKEKSISFYKSQITKEIIDKIRKYAESLGSKETLFERIWMAKTCKYIL